MEICREDEPRYIDCYHCQEPFVLEVGLVGQRALDLNAYTVLNILKEQINKQETVLGISGSDAGFTVTVSTFFCE